MFPETISHRERQPIAVIDELPSYDAVTAAANGRPRADYQLPDGSILRGIVRDHDEQPAPTRDFTTSAGVIVDATLICPPSPIDVVAELKAALDRQALIDELDARTRQSRSLGGGRTIVESDCPQVVDWAFAWAAVGGRVRSVRVEPTRYDVTVNGRIVLTIVRRIP